MTTQTTTLPITRQPAMNTWVRLGALAAVLGIAAVLVVQALALAVWPEAAQFGPLDNYARSALFTLVPAVAATGLFAWLARRRERPVGTFVRISLVVLLVSIIPDYVLPVPHRTMLASTLTALLHVVAALVIVTVLVRGYRRETRAVR